MSFRGGARGGFSKGSSADRDAQYARDFKPSPDDDNVQDDLSKGAKNSNNNNKDKKFSRDGRKNDFKTRQNDPKGNKNTPEDTNIIIPDAEDDPEFFKASNPRAGNKSVAVKSSIAIPQHVHQQQFHPKQPSSQDHNKGDKQQQQYNRDDKKNFSGENKDHKRDRNDTNNTTRGNRNDKNEQGDKGMSKGDNKNETKLTNTTNKRTKHFNFNHINPFDITNECMVCSYPIKIYAGSSCGHTNDLCGECILKLRLFAKQTTSNTTINPITGQEEQHRATVLLKQEYIDQCDQETNDQLNKVDDKNNNNNNNNNRNIPLATLLANTISDPSLDVDFIAQCRSRDAVCLFCHVPITPLLLSKTPIKPATYQLLTLLVKFNSVSKTSQEWKDLRTEMYNLVNITYQQAKLSKKTFSTFIETNFVYNAHLDVYTLPQDGWDFAETIENVSVVSCKKCISHNDDQTKYTKSATFTTTFNNDFTVTYQTIPLIEPKRHTIQLSVNLPEILPSKYDTQPEPTTVDVGNDRTFDLIPSDDYHQQTTETNCSISTMQYKHESFSTLRQLHNHTQQCHGLEICTACYGVSHDFIPDRSLFNAKEIIIHGKKNQHSICGLCRHQCYDNDELYAHLVDPANKHYICRHCTTDVTVQQNDLSQFGSSQAKKQTFKFLRSKAAYVLHMHHEHFVCDHPSCKQYDPTDTKNLNMSDPARVVNPQKMVVFSNQFDLQQHQINVHHNKPKGSNASKKIDLTAMFTATSNRTTTTTASTTPLPGYARTGTSNAAQGHLPVIKDEDGKIIKNTLEADDVFLYTRIVQLSGDTQTASTALLSIGDLGANPSINNNNTTTTTPSTTNTASVETLYDAERSSNLNLRDRQNYQDLFPTLRGDTSNLPPSNQNQNPYAKNTTTKKQAFPSFGGGAKNQTKQEAFPSFGSTKATGAGSSAAASSSSSSNNSTKTNTMAAMAANKGPTTVVAQPQPTPPPSNLTQKKNTLNDFINWNRVAPAGTSLLNNSAKKKTNANHYYDYSNSTDGDIITSVGYHYEPIGSTSKSSFAATMGHNYHLDTNYENDIKRLHGNKDIDFPMMLGTASPSAQVSTKANKQIQDAKANKNKKKNIDLFSPSPASPMGNAWGVSSPTSPVVAQPKKANKQKAQAHQQQPQANNKNNHVFTDVKNTNAKNTGLVGGNGTSNGLVVNKLITQPSVASTERNSYENQLQKYIKTESIEIGQEINKILSNPDNKGNKASLIDALLFTPTENTTKTKFETICEHVRSLELPKFIPSFSTIELLQVMTNTTLFNVLSNAHKKSLTLLAQQLSILMQSLLISDDVTIDNFYKDAKILAQVPTGPNWKLIAAAMAQLTQKYPPFSTVLPQLLQYPGMDTLPVIGEKNRLLLVSTLQSNNNTTATLNKVLVPLVNDAMNLPKRLFLYMYLQAYLKMFVFRPTTLQKLISNYLRSLDAQETM